jgi:hypothetical protein
MSTIVLPTLTDGTQRYDFRIMLGGSFFGFDFRWNPRDSSWGFVLSDASGNALLTRKVALGLPMLYRAADSRLPNGELYAIDTTGKGQEAGLTDLGGRVQLSFTDAADIAALIA